MTKRNYISYTQIDTYLRCPYLYNLIYQEDFKQPDSPAFLFGGCIHHTLHQYGEYYSLTGHHDSDIIKGMWSLACENQEVARKPMPPVDYQKGSRILGVLLDSEKLDLSSAVAYEEDFLIDFGGVMVKGIIDRVDIPQEGVYRIVDYKSGGSIYSGDDIENSLQLGIYAAAFEQMTDERIRYLSVAVHQVNQNVFIERTKELADLEDIRRYVADIYKRIQSDTKRDTNPGEACLRYGGCPAAHICPEHAVVQMDGLDLSIVPSGEILKLLTQLDLRKKLLMKALRGRLEAEEDIHFGGRKALLSPVNRSVPDLSVLYTLMDSFGLDPFDFSNFDSRKFEKAVKNKIEDIQVSDRADKDFMLEQLEEMRDAAYNVEPRGSQIRIKNDVP